MLKILCCNEKCTAPGRIFLWDERSYLLAEGKLAKKEDEGAVSFVERCPSCGTKNKIWVTKVRETEVTRKMV
ncbi:MAG: hypothetical protein PHW87_11710 [Methanothrix sp.]|nr:hypothetical protein [Methanothrix sp.]